VGEMGRKERGYRLVVQASSTPQMMLLPKVAIPLERVGRDRSELTKGSSGDR